VKSTTVEFASSGSAKYKLIGTWGRVIAMVLDSE